MTNLLAELADVVQLSRTNPRAWISAALNFVDTHHAEIEAMARDAARLEVVEDRLLTLVNAIKRAGGDPLAWSQWNDAEREAIDQAMHDSAREASKA